MKNIITAVIFLSLFLLYPPFLCAQEATGDAAREYPKVVEKKCVPLGEMELSSEQSRAIECVREKYREKLFCLREQLLAKRIELTAILNDPAADVETIREKGRDIELLNARFEELVLEYQIAIRHELTPQQVRVWCVDQDSALKREWK